MKLHTTRKTVTPAAANVLAAVTLCLIPIAARCEARESRSHETQKETVGVLSGLAIGAAAAGPFGAVLGAAAGAWVGDRVQREEMGRRVAQRDLDLSRSRGMGLTVNAMFRTGGCELRPEDAEALAHLARLALQMHAVNLKVSGFADPRGAAELNLALSARRAQGVAQWLRDQGIAADRIIVEALGAVGGGSDLDGYAFERRVTVQIQSAAL